jgi:hypothetical protein
MIHQARVLRLGKVMEEEVLLRLGDVRLICFANVRPYRVEEGEMYSVEFHPLVFDEYVVTEVDGDTAPSIVERGPAFRCVITGRLRGSTLDSVGLTFEDEIFAKDYAYLDGKMIAMNVDRMDVEFISSKP